MNKKFDFECIYYTNSMIEKLQEEKFFEINLILPEKLRYIVLQLAQNNYDALGSFTLSETQLNKAFEHAQMDSFNETIKAMTKEGLLSYTGVDAKGEFTLGLTDAGRAAKVDNDEMIKNAQEIQRIITEPDPSTDKNVE